MTRWEDYEPGWLVELARAQHPEKPWLANALERCTRAQWESRAYVYFVEPERLERPITDERSRSNLLLQSEQGDIVLDPLDGCEIGGAEFLWLA